MATGKAAKKAWTDKSCKEITELVYDYLNDKLSPAVKRDLKQHLRLCPDCISFLNTYKKTVAVTRSFNSEEIPPRVRDNIWAFLRKRMRRT
ncbi:MAG TPA: anti-sigma factor [Candidatus Binatia bacterium]|nr:anti-sigma factor [Candidatus Binatia bacterium]